MPASPKQACRVISLLEHGGNPEAKVYPGELRVSGIVNPDINVDKLAQALLHIAATLNGPPPVPNAEGGHVEDDAA